MPLTMPMMIMQIMISNIIFQNFPPTLIVQYIQSSAIYRYTPVALCDDAIGGAKPIKRGNMGGLPGDVSEEPVT